ncbi:MAG: rhomboid family intramembrane serine protease [Tannerella sp.]|jgi:membrane associated rhomboid family serine protease|nr:rhomboid family intramembrane serine protease [Tannerella sp.]
MEGIFNRIRDFYRRGNVLTKLLFVNVAVFLLIRLIYVAAMLFRADGLGEFTGYLQFPSLPAAFIRQPWSLLTYMFLHTDFLHILFNMLWLYWFGKIFLEFFSERHLGGIYVMGGIAGAALFMLSYNVFPYFRDAGMVGMLMGASASVMAIVFAAAFYRNDYEINLLFIGRIKLIYLALFVMLLDLLSITSVNAGGHIAHLGGALFGILFAVRYRNGQDLTAAVNRLIDRIVNLFKPKPRMRVTYRRTETDMEYNARKKQESDAIDAILDKLKRSGYDSLSNDEKKTLFNAGKQ